jgi:hypothetical protein
MVGLVGLEILQLLLQVGRLCGVTRVAGFFQLTSVLGDVGVDAFQGLCWPTGYSYPGSAPLRYPQMGSLSQGLSPGADNMGGNFRIAVIRFPRLLAALLLVAWLAACSSRQPKPVDPNLTKAEELKRKALQQCRRYRGSLPLLSQRFTETQGRLKAIAAERFVSAMPPLPLDPEEQRLLTIYDQETEQQLYDEAQAAWKRSEAERRQVWEQAKAQRQAAAEQELEQLADQLRSISPDLLQAEPPVRLNQPQLKRYLSCKPENFR